MLGGKGGECDAQAQGICGSRLPGTGAGARLQGIGKRTRLAGVDDGSYTTEAHVKNRKGARYDGAWGSRKIL